MKTQQRGFILSVDIFFLIAAIVLLCLPNEIEYLPYIGFLLIPLSFYMLYKCRNNRFLSYLLGIMFLINLSLSINDFILKGEHIISWQILLMRSSPYNVITAKSLLSFVAVFNLFLNGKILHPQTEWIDLYNERKTNRVVSVGSLFILIGILIYGFVYELPSHVDGYSSVSNPIYEYSIIIYALAWLNAKNAPILNKCLLCYAVVFMLFFFRIGDRSSASMYLIFLLITLYKRKINILVLCLGGILLLAGFNFVGIIRSSDDWTFSYLLPQLLVNALYSDTASYAYYASITVVAAGLKYAHPLEMIIGFLGSIIGIRSPYSDLASYALSMDSYNWFNRGGGFFPTYFTAWFGNVGGIVAGIIFGLIVLKIFKKNKGIGLYYKLLFITFIIRWYIYTPYVLFRSVFFIGGVAYMLYSLVILLLKPKKCI